MESNMQKEKDEKIFNLPTKWTVTKHDRALIFAVCEKGIGFLKQMRYSDDYNMQGMKVTKKKLLRRLEYLCKFFKE
jgi:hypothetical protein